LGRAKFDLINFAYTGHYGSYNRYDCVLRNCPGELSIYFGIVRDSSLRNARSDFSCRAVAAAYFVNLPFK